MRKAPLSIPFINPARLRTFCPGRRKYSVGNLRFLKGFIFLILLFTRVLLDASIYGSSYKILILEQNNISNSAPKTSADYLVTGVGYSMFGSVLGIGAISIASRNYNANLSVLTSWRPPQDNVNTSHAYPNPCNLKKGCNGVSFTRLTLRCEIKIYNISGEEIIIINKDTNLDTIAWDLRTKDGKYVSSGLYIYFVKGADGSTRKGKLVIVR